MQALLIRFDVETGRRPRNIDPHDPKLQCYGWQNLEMRPALEIRVIEDDRDISQYKRREAEGITVLYNDAEIDAAIEQYIPVRYLVEDELLFRVHLEQKRIILADVPGKSRDEILKHLKSEGIKGIREMRRPKMSEVYGARA